MGDFLVWLSGASPRVLRRCPTERSKFVGIGGAILVTAGMAAVSMGFGLYNAVKAPLPVAVFFALLWGLAILSLDRLFVVSMRRYRNWLYSLLMALPRLAMAVLLGFVISTPFVLQIFRPEIDHQIALSHAAQRSAYYNNLPHNPLYLAVQKDQAAVTTLTSEAATGGTGINPSSDPTLQNLNKELSTATANENSAFANLQCQLYGTALPGGRQCIQGNGPLAQDDQQAYESARNQVSTLTQQVQAREKQLGDQSAAAQTADKAQYASQLKTAKAALASAQQQLSLQTASVTSGINADNGLLTQLKGLSAATAGNASLWWARLLLFLVFLVIDIMPVFIKFLLNIAPESAYDVQLAAEERRQARSAENARAAQLAMERQTDQAQVAVERERLAAVIAPQPEVRERIIAARQRADMEWLREWEEDQRRRIADGAWISPPASAPVPTPAPAPAPPPVWASQDRRPLQEGGVRQGPPPTQAWAPPTRRMEQPTRPWEQRPGLLGRISFGLLGRRSAASRGRQESWREWPTNTGTPSPNGVRDPSVR